ncbi:MAG: sensor histidine kinase [Deltaproteobacteria bacterium]
MAVRIAVASTAVTVVAVAIISVGVFVFGSRSFETLMLEHGSDVADAQSMFDQSVTGFFVVATVAALAASVVLAVLLARWLTAPLQAMSSAARRLAGGERTIHIAPDGPREVSALATSFNELAARLAEQERMRSEFIANAAHELRTPLTNLLGYLDALRDGVFPATPETFASLREEVERLVRLSRSLDALATGDRQSEILLSDVDVRESIEAALELVLPSFARKDIALTVEVPGSLHARANRDHLAQVLANLLQNAERYTPEGGRVSVVAERGPGSVVVTVANNGDRIPAGDVPHVFERFYRVEKSRDRARGGAGIGLAIVKQLVELGGGDVGVDSSEQLTRFWFRIPA